MEELLEPIFRATLEGEANTVAKQVQAALDAGLAPDQILNKSLLPAISEVGSLFESGEYFLPEMMIAARAMQAGLDILKPLLVAANVQPAGKVLIGTVQGDLHDLGKNLVGMMLQGAGFEVQDLGVDVPPEAFVDAVRDAGPGLVAMSALLTTTMPVMQSVIKALQEAGLRDRVKVMVGGAPVTDAFAQRIGADGYAPDASRAAKLARALVG